MASWNIPALINKISEDVPAIKALLTALFKWTDAGTEDVPEGAKRLQSVTGGKQIQEYSGSSWGSVGKLMHDVDMLDGKHASTAQTPDTIPVRDANGSIPGNVTGNAATATTASSVSSEYVVPIANGGTGATSAANARTNLGTDNAENITAGVLATARGGTGRNDGKVTDVFLEDYQTGAVGLGQLGSAVTKNAVNCDTLTKQGVYGCINCTVALKYPTGGNFFVDVFQNGNNILQRASQCGLNNTYIRRSTNSGASWTGWTPDDVSTIEDFHIYVSKGGSDANNGLTADTPVLTFVRALEIAKGVKTNEGLIFHFGPGEWGDLWIRHTYIQSYYVKITNYPNSNVQTVADFNNLTESGNTGNQPPHFTKIEMTSPGLLAFGNISVDYLFINLVRLIAHGVVSISNCTIYNCWADFIAHIVRKRDTTAAVFQLSHAHLYIGNSASSFVDAPTNYTFIAAADNSSICIDNRATWSGSFSGKKFDFSGLCSIIRDSLDPTSWPGNSKGTGSYFYGLGGRLGDKLIIENSGSKIELRDPAVVKGTAPSDNRWEQIIFQDTNQGAFACVEHGYLTTKENRIALLAMNPNVAGWENIQMGIGYDANGKWFTFTPTPSATDDSTKFANTNWVRTATGNTSLKASNVTGTVAIANGGTGATNRLSAVRNLFDVNIASVGNHFLMISSNFNDAGFVFVDQARSILNCLLLSGGTMTGNLAIKNSFPSLLLQHTSEIRGTNPSNDTWSGVYFLDGSKNSGIEQRASCIETSVSSNGDTHLYLNVYEWQANVNNGVSISIHYPKNGTPYTIAPTPPANSNGTNIATTEWVRGRLGGGEYGIVPSGNPQSRSSGTEYTAATNGFVVVRTTAYNGNCTHESVTVNGYTFNTQTSSYGSGSCAQRTFFSIPCKKGWKYTGNTGWIVWIPA